MEKKNHRVNEILTYICAYLATFEQSFKFFNRRLHSVFSFMQLCNLWNYSIWESNDVAVDFFLSEYTNVRRYSKLKSLLLFTYNHKDIIAKYKKKCQRFAKF